MKVRLSNGKFATVIKDLSSITSIIRYSGAEGESTRVVSMDEIMNGPIDLCLFDNSLNGTNSNYTQIKRNNDGSPKK